MTNTQTVTKEQVKAGLNLVVAVTEAIREAGRVPSGELYAVLLGKVDIHGFNRIVSIVTGSGLVEKRGDVLVWTGPSFAEGRSL